MSISPQIIKPETLSVVDADIDHRSAVFDILKQGWVDVYPKILGVSEAEVKDVFEDDTGKPNPEYFYDLDVSIAEPSAKNYSKVAILGTEVLGFYQYAVEPRNPGEYKMLQKLYVGKEVRRRGIGRRLLKDALESHAEEEMDLLVARKNTIAINFYRQAGFFQVGTSQTEYEFGGEPVPLAAMRRKPAPLPEHLLNL